MESNNDKVSTYQEDKIIIDAYVPGNEYIVHETKWTELQGNSEATAIRNGDVIVPPSVTDERNTKSVRPWVTQIRSASI